MGKIRNIAIIPARGGSKRLPRKNIKSFLGKPIIAYSIEAAINCGLFDEVMVSTDDKEIAEIAKSFGASVPFMRSETNADDFAGLADVIEEVLLNYRKENKLFMNACCILPTAPFINKETLTNGYAKLVDEKFNSVFPILEYSYPIQRSLKVRKARVEMVWGKYLNSRSQDLKPRYHDAGQFYWIKTEQFIKDKKIFTNNSGGVIISELLAQDIDNETDFKLAEIKYKLMLDD